MMLITVRKFKTSKRVHQKCIAEAFKFLTASQAILILKHQMSETK